MKKIKSNSYIEVTLDGKKQTLFVQKAKKNHLTLITVNLIGSIFDNYNHDPELTKRLIEKYPTTMGVDLLSKDAAGEKLEDLNKKLQSEANLMEYLGESQPPRIVYEAETIDGKTFYVEFCKIGLSLPQEFTVDTKNTYLLSSDTEGKGMPVKMIHHLNPKIINDFGYRPIFYKADGWRVNEKGRQEPVFRFTGYQKILQSGDPIYIEILSKIDEPLEVVFKKGIKSKLSKKVQIQGDKDLYSAITDFHDKVINQDKNSSIFEVNKTMQGPPKNHMFPESHKPTIPDWMLNQSGPYVKAVNMNFTEVTANMNYPASKVLPLKNIKKVQLWHILQPDILKAYGFEFAYASEVVVKNSKKYYANSYVRVKSGKKEAVHLSLESSPCILPVTVKIWSSKDNTVKELDPGHNTYVISDQQELVEVLDKTLLM